MSKKKKVSAPKLKALGQIKKEVEERIQFIADSFQIPRKYVEINLSEEELSFATLYFIDTRTFKGDDLGFYSMDNLDKFVSFECKEAIQRKAENSRKAHYEYLKKELEK